MKTEISGHMTKALSFFSDEQAGRLILHNMQESFVLVNPQLSIVYCNRAARHGIRQFLGFDVYPGMNILELTQESRKPVLEEIFAAVLQGHHHITEAEFIDSAGKAILYENTFLPAYNDEEEIIGIIVSSKDITERKRAQQAILESEERLQFALEAANQGAWDWNLQTNEVIYSDSYKKMYGFEKNDLKHDISEWITRIHPEDQNKMGESVAEHLKADQHVYDSKYRIRGKDGKYRWVMAKGRLISFDDSGKPLRMIGTQTDITEAVEREQEMERINERFDCMLKATHELLWEWDIQNNQILRSRDGVKKVYGISDDAPFLKLEAWLQRIHPEDREEIKNTIEKILSASHQQTFEMEYRFKRDNGEFAHIYDRCILLKDEKDKPVRLIGAAQDISERKRLEKELLKNELEYQRLIHQATVDSQEKERAEIGKELHDNINQVLTTTKLYLDLATTNQELKEELIRKSILNINNVIQEIRHLSRSLMDPSIDDLGLIDSIKDLIENIHLTQQIKILFMADEAIESQLDANQKLTVFRIIQESLNNVLRHAKANIVTIEISSESNALQLTISDDGIGFGAANLKRGAGLKNIQNRIYLINGTLQIESSPGEGCTIQLQFPINKLTEN